MNRCEDVGPWAGRPRAEMMRSNEVEAMLHLHALGWGLKRIAREFGCSKNTVRRYVAADGWMAYSRPVRGGKLEDQEAWLKECFFRHRGNAEVVRQDLLRELSIDVSLRTVERAVAPFRRLLTAEAKATVRFETAPGHQLQIDFGELRVPIADERVRVYLFVATLGYSRTAQTPPTEPTGIVVLALVHETTRTRSMIRCDTDATSLRSPLQQHTPFLRGVSFRCRRGVNSGCRLTTRARVRRAAAVPAAGAARRSDL